MFPQALFEAGVKIKGTDVPTWISIMSERSVPHLQRGKPTHLFERHWQRDFFFLISSHHCGKCSRSLSLSLFILQCSRSTRVTAPTTCRRASSKRSKGICRNLSWCSVNMLYKQSMWYIATIVPWCSCYSWQYLKKKKTSKHPSRSNWYYCCMLFFCLPVQCFENKQLYFAKRLNEAMKVDTSPAHLYTHLAGDLKNHHRLWKCRFAAGTESKSWQESSYSGVASAAAL